MPRSNAAIARELAAIRKSFASLAASFSRLAPILSPEPRIVYLNRDGRPRKKPRFSAAYRASLKLQGKYMGTMRGLPPAKRAVVKRVRVEKGIRAAIAEAQRLMG